jgi:hypothetical protein
MGDHSGATAIIKALGIGLAGAYRSLEENDRVLGWESSPAALSAR